MLVSDIYLCLLSCVLIAVSHGDIQYQEHLKPIGSGSPLHGITVMETLPSPEYFYKWFLKPGVPVLFRSALMNPEFTYPAYKLWTDEYLRKKYGKSEIYIEHHKKERRNRKDYDSTVFTDFLEQYQSSDIYMVHDLTTVPKMMVDVHLPPFLRCGGAQKLMTLFNMWFSSGGTKSVLHSDSYENINCLLDGTKNLIFYDKKYEKVIEADGFIVEEGYSKLDVDRVDLNKFPFLKSIPWMNVTMKEGDCLYIPRNWYHQVNSFGTRNLAVNTWFEHPLWFNQSECANTDQSKRKRSLIFYLLTNVDELIRVVIFKDLEAYSHIGLTEKNVMVLVTEKKDAKEIFAYLDGNHDDQVSWEEIHQVKIQDFLKRFRSLLTEDVQSLVKDAESRQIRFTLGTEKGDDGSDRDSAAEHGGESQNIGEHITKEKIEL